MAQQELLERLQIIERIVEEGRSETSSWGWCLMLWGFGHAGAMIWTVLGRHDGMPWWVLMSACGVLTLVGGAYVRRAEGHVTTSGRATAGIWLSLAVSMFLLFALGGNYRGVAPRLLVAAFCVLLAMANFASGHLLRWTAQRLNGMFLWTCTVAALLAPDVTTLFWIFMFAVVVGEIGFGLYLIMLERSARSKHAATAV